MLHGIDSGYNRLGCTVFCHLIPYSTDVLYTVTFYIDIIYYSVPVQPSVDYGITCTISATSCGTAYAGSVYLKLSPDFFLPYNVFSPWVEYLTNLDVEVIITCILPR